MDKELDLTTGVIWKQLLLFFFPILIGTFFQQLYNTCLLYTSAMVIDGGSTLPETVSVGA